MEKSFFINKIRKFYGKKLIFFIFEMCNLSLFLSSIFVAYYHLTPQPFYFYLFIYLFFIPIFIL